MSTQSAVTRIVANIRHAAARAHGLLIPVSGGSDSALCLWLCTQAIGDKAVGAFCGDNLRCHEWFHSFATIRYLRTDPLWEDAEIMRWALLQTAAKREYRWLVGAHTRTEMLLGNYSLASRAATFLPMANLWKTEVMALCAEIGVPRQITDSSRRADPDCGRPVEMSEIPLELVDLFARRREVGMPAIRRKLTPEQLAYLIAAEKTNAFRSRLPVLAPRVRVLDRTKALQAASAVVAASRKGKGTTSATTSQEG